MGRHGCQEDSCYKTFEKEDNLKEHIQDSHNGGKYGINTDFKCDECGEEFNKFTTLKMGKLPLKEYFERHTWIHKVVNFKCDCADMPDLRPGQYNIMFSCYVTGYRIKTSTLCVCR